MDALIFALTAVAIGYLLVPIGIVVVPVVLGGLFLAAWAMK